MQHPEPHPAVHKINGEIQWVELNTIRLTFAKCRTTCPLDNAFPRYWGNGLGSYKGNVRQEQKKRDIKETNHVDVQEDVSPLSAFYTWDGNNSPFTVAYGTLGRTIIFCA